MQIIDKNKDYYDYCQFEFGTLDKTATYDRRGSGKMDRRHFFSYCFTNSMLLEVGYVQYVFKSNNLLWEDGQPYDGNLVLLNKFDEGLRLCPAPVTLVPIYNGDVDFKSARDIEIDDYDDEYEPYFENPILIETPIPSLIPAREFYNNLDNYFRSLKNDKAVKIENSDIEKAINHGFDKKTSFRHPVK
jgi:hypothetical protein